MISKRFTIQSCMILGFIFLAACNSVRREVKAEDLSFLTPIPDTTLNAYQPGTLITDKLQAAVAARAFLSSNAIISLQTPRLVSVNRMTLAEVKKKTLKPGEDINPGLPFYTPVWLVIFRADWQPSLDQPPPPGKTATPLPVYTGCQYVWMTENGNGISATGNIYCESR